MSILIMTNFRTTKMKAHYANVYSTDSAKRESKTLKNKLQPPICGPLHVPTGDSQHLVAEQQALDTINRGRQQSSGLGADYDFVTRNTGYQFDDIIEPFASLNDLINEAEMEDDMTDTNLLFTQTIHDDSEIFDSVYSMEIDGSHPMNLFGDLGLYFNLPLFGARGDQTDDLETDGTIIEDLPDESENNILPDEGITEGINSSTYQINIRPEIVQNFDDSVNMGSESDDDIERQLQRLSDNIMERNVVEDVEALNEKHRRNASLTTDQSEASQDSDMMSTSDNERFSFSSGDDMSVVSAIEFVGRKRNRW